LGLLQVAVDPSRALAQSVAVFMGQVTSAEEGPVEGVMVTAKKAGSTIAISVVSDEKGQLPFSKREDGAWPTHAAHPRHRL
jgi:hypothetical protein